MILATKMWIDTLINRYLNDNSTIPEDIGNQCLIQGNLYMAKKGISKYIIINEWSDVTDMSFSSSLLDYVKQKVPNVEINIIYKPSKAIIDLSSATIEANVQIWQSQMNKKVGVTNKHLLKRAARCLDTVDILREGKNTLYVQTVIEVRSLNHKSVHQGMQVVKAYLDNQFIDYSEMGFNVKKHIEWLKLSNGKTTTKEIPKSLFSTETFSQILPTVQAINNDKGVYIGQDILNNSPYFIDLGGSRAKNIYILGNSGSGKTVLALFMSIMAGVQDYNISVSDIKGNEFTGLIEALGGEIVSLRAVDDGFINVFKLDYERHTEKDYFTRMSLYKQRFLYYIISPREEDESLCNSFITEFLKVIHIINGVSENPNTWSKTLKIHPLHLYAYLKNFLSDKVREVYGDVATRAEMNFKEYLDPLGSMSYLFRREIDYVETVKNKYISFDFGILKSSRNATNNIISNIKYLYHDIINDDFIVNKVKEHPNTKTILIEEESQLVSKDILKMYATNFTVRRAQNCINVLLGNSMSALLEVQEAKSIFDNINIIMIGKIIKENMELVNRYFELSDRAKDFITAIANEKTTNTSYFYVNDMSKESIDTIINPKIPSSYFNTCKIFMKGD